jgi:hypothetical protein
MDKGVQAGDIGYVYYTIKIDNREKKIHIARFRILSAQGRSSRAVIVSNKGEVQKGYLAEIKVKSKLSEEKISVVETGKVVYVVGNAIHIDKGMSSGIRHGDEGRVYYTITANGQDEKIYIARFRIQTSTWADSVATITAKVMDVQQGHFVEIRH